MMKNKKLSINYILRVKCDWEGCNKTFARSQSLIEHVRTHTGERPFRCSICQKSFTRKSGLNIHNRIHSGERPFQCDWGKCTRSFHTKYKLTIHQRIHYKIKPYTCKFPCCSYSCSDVSDTLSLFLYIYLRIK